MGISFDSIFRNGTADKGNTEKKPEPRQALHQAASKGRIERWSDLSSGFRTLALNLGIFALAFLLIYIYIDRNPPTIVIGKIGVNDFGRSMRLSPHCARAQH